MLLDHVKCFKTVHRREQRWHFSTEKYRWNSLLESIAGFTPHTFVKIVLEMADLVLQCVVGVDDQHHLILLGLRATGLGWALQSRLWQFNQDVVLSREEITSNSEGKLSTCLVQDNDNCALAFKCASDMDPNTVFYTVKQRDKWLFIFLTWLLWKM